jgi:outer membrane immunogenic protein
MRKPVHKFAMPFIFLTGFVGSSFAADMAYKAPPVAAAPVYAWTGWYAGINFGIGFNANSTFDTLQRFTGGGTVPHPLQSAGDGSHILGGVQLGYNMQAGQWVYGLETDFDGRSGRNSGGLREGPMSMNMTENDGWFGTTRLRAGWLYTNQALFYATGGVAYGSDGFNAAIVGPGPVHNFGFSSSKIATGWTAGGGVEWAMDAHWSVKAEYLYLHLSDTATKTIVFNSGQTGVFTGLNFDNSHVVRVGLNYRM